MNKMICQKCGDEISNEFTNTLLFCTNCGASLNFTEGEKTLSSTDAETLYYPTPQLPKAKSEKILIFVIGGLGLFSLVVLAVGGLFISPPPIIGTKQYQCTIPGEPEPQTSDEYVRRGKKHVELSDYSGTFDECEFGACAEAVRLDPTNAPALACRGNSYRLLKKYDEALADLNESIRLAPDVATSYQIRSAIYNARKLYDEAIADQNKAIKIYAGEGYQSPYNLAERGELYFLKGDYENAVSDYSKAISLKPDLDGIYAKRAMAYRKLGKNDLADKDEAQADFFKNVKTNTNYRRN